MFQSNHIHGHWMHVEDMVADKLNEIEADN